jgi:hypothetical protein
VKRDPSKGFDDTGIILGKGAYGIVKHVKQKKYKKEDFALKIVEYNEYDTDRKNEIYHEVGLMMTNKS